MEKAEMSTPGSILDQGILRDALAQFASGVTVVTTTDEVGKPWGFTASSFCSVSSEPPLVLVCLADDAECHPVFASEASFAVNVLRAEDEAVAMTFASRGADKFAGFAFASHPQEHVPVLENALATLVCRTADRHLAGDHVILVGEAVDAWAHDGSPMVYYDRAFRRLVAR
jgi:flavin reductase ActVB